ncbi:hypothetical protein HF086_008413 [Spodoptera exigua]|uniref:TIL domain-containing protein n=1 Tax=Spodoptera exigua TaxID=7107 RepID=A0A922MGD3_SPOEX|nr:hypothetical protein HF086_008413 [Spodoptera exigua]
MAIKLLVLSCLLQVLSTNAQENKYPSLRDITLVVPSIVINAENSFDPYYRDIDKPSDLDYCNETACTPPCPGAPPPKHCPTDTPVCHFGCACHTDCDIGIVYCFQTKDCLQPRRFFTKHRRITKIIE